MNVNQYRISELAEKSGVTKRTIHYYLGRGLLPPSEGEGLGTKYSDEHLYRIMLIKKLQDNYLPLEEIKKRLAVMELCEVKKSLNEDVIIEEQSARLSQNCESGKFGVPYERISIGFGVEIHFPQENKKAYELAEKLYHLAEKIMKEG